MRGLKTISRHCSADSPMFSAKKQNGKKLYELARKGIEVEQPVLLSLLETKLTAYHYPFLDLHVTCSKGTYIRSIAHDLGSLLGSGAHLLELTRLRSGLFRLGSNVSTES